MLAPSSRTNNSNSGIVVENIETLLMPLLLYEPCLGHWCWIIYHMSDSHFDNDENKYTAAITIYQHNVYMIGLWLLPFFVATGHSVSQRYDSGIRTNIGYINKIPAFFSCNKRPFLVYKTKEWLSQSMFH